MVLKDDGCALFVDSSLCIPEEHSLPWLREHNAIIMALGYVEWSDVSAAVLHHNCIVDASSELETHSRSLEGGSSIAHRSSPCSAANGVSAIGFARYHSLRGSGV